MIIELSEKSKFTIVGPKKKYFFKVKFIFSFLFPILNIIIVLLYLSQQQELDHPANIWVEKVQKLIKDKFEDKQE